MLWPDGSPLLRRTRLHIQSVPARLLHMSMLAGIACALLTGCAWPWHVGETVQATPTPQYAGGEPVLPQLQVLDHLAPSPPPDTTATTSAWPLAAADPANTFAARAAAVQGTVRWFFQTPGPALATPVVASGLALVAGGDGTLYAVDVGSGGLRWRAPLGDALVAGTPAVAGNRVYVAVQGHGLAMLDLATGAPLWMIDTRAPVRAAPLVDGSLLFVATGANTLLCLDRATGAQYWAFKSEDAFAAYWPTSGQPAVTSDDGGRVFIALGASTEFDALDARTGRKVWEYSVTERMVGAPVYSHPEHLVYIVTWTGHLYALDARTGARRWQFALPNADSPGAGFSAAPALAGDTLVLADLRGGVTALDATTGSVRWTTQDGARIVATPLARLDNGGLAQVIVADQGGRLLLLDGPTGKVEQRLTLGELRASPVLAAGMLFAASVGARGLFALS